MTDYRAELQRLVKAYDEHGGRWPDHHEQALSDAVEAARTALAQPEPEGVTEHDIAELAEDIEWKRLPQDEATRPSFLLEFARAILTRYAHPAIESVPVAERPEPEDCDAQERCWWFRPADFSDDVSVPSWHLDASPGPGQVRFYGYTHWRPHNALPVPGAEVQS
jgi:hypothetical protein